MAFPANVFSQFLLSINKTFKDEVRKQSEKHVEENIDRYTEEKITVSERLILLTKWVADAWDNVDPAVIICGVKKCGYSVALDGSENDEVHIEKLNEYIMPNPSDEDGGKSILYWIRTMMMIRMVTYAKA